MKKKYKDPKSAQTIHYYKKQGLSEEEIYAECHNLFTNEYKEYYEEKMRIKKKLEVEK